MPKLARKRSRRWRCHSRSTRWRRDSGKCRSGRPALCGQAILRAAARRADAVWFSIQLVDFALLDGDAA